jgi:hypothetical protein
MALFGRGFFSVRDACDRAVGHDAVLVAGGFFDVGVLAAGYESDLASVGLTGSGKDEVFAVTHPAGATWWVRERGRLWRLEQVRPREPRSPRERR